LFWKIELGETLLIGMSLRACCDEGDYLEEEEIEYDYD
jgi:hypothetical protein